MTSTQITLVKNSWRLLRQVSPELLVDTFYSKLFFDHPELRRMFPKKMDEQYQKLYDMLAAIVHRLENLESFRQEITDMARRHDGYGVRPGHYAMVGSALLWTLEKALGTDWTAETAAAWTACYGVLAEQMQVRGAGPV
ncbi:MAG: hypothetical protein KF852_18280 [Saprospiraceae bacterium]|nr:hypothetical protein [Saprospiraceae bacterium]